MTETVQTNRVPRWIWLKSRAVTLVGSGGRYTPPAEGTLAFSQADSGF